MKQERCSERKSHPLHTGHRPNNHGAACWPARQRIAGLAPAAGLPAPPGVRLASVVPPHAELHLIQRGPHWPGSSWVRRAACECCSRCDAACSGLRPVAGRQAMLHCRHVLQHGKRRRRCQQGRQGAMGPLHQRQRLLGMQCTQARDMVTPGHSQPGSPAQVCQLATGPTGSG